MCSSKVSMLFMWSIAIQRKWDPFEMKRSLTKKLRKRKKLSKFKLILLTQMDLKTSLSFSLYFWNRLSIFNWMVIQIKENLILWIQLATTSGKINSLMEAKTLDKIHSFFSKVNFLSNQDTKTGISTKILKETSSNLMANSFKTSSILTETALILLLHNISTKLSSLKCKLTNPCLLVLSSNSKLPLWTKTFRDCQVALLLLLQLSLPQILLFLSTLTRNMLKTTSLKSETCSPPKSSKILLTEERKKRSLGTQFTSMLKSLWVKAKLQRSLECWLTCLRLSWIIRSFSGMNSSKKWCLLFRWLLSLMFSKRALSNFLLLTSELSHFTSYCIIYIIKDSLLRLRSYSNSFSKTEL